MDQGFRRGCTAAEKAELWDRWQRGESLKAIGRAFGKLPIPLITTSFPAEPMRKLLQRSQPAAGN